MALKDFTLLDLYRRNAQFFPDRTAFVFAGQRVTHRQYLGRVERLAAGLAREGIEPGDRVAILSQNSPEMVDLIGAVAALGAILLPVNFRLNAEEIGFVLADGTPKLVVAAPDYQEIIATLKTSLPSVRRYFGIGSHAAPFVPFADLVASDAPLTESDFSADDGFVIIHTAAVGGRPRGALLSQTGLLTAQSSLVQAWQLTEHDVNLGVLPLFHVAGLGLMLTVQQAGGASVIAAKFDPAQAVRDIAAEKVTVMSEFAPMLTNLMDRANGDELATLRAVTGLDTPETVARFEAACPNAMFWATFGQSETSGIATLSPYRDRPKSAGRPLFWRTIAVVDTTDTPRPTGQTGEIVVRGPTVFKGYWNNKLDTDFTFRNGWHHTGDMGYFDADGYLWYAGRAPEKDLIKTGGENVYPAEVENAIFGAPGVADVAVIGVPDEKWGEAVKAIVVKKPGEDPSAESIIAWAKERIAAYKAPKTVDFIDALPRNPSGKILRKDLREPYWKGMTRRVG